MMSFKAETGDQWALLLKIMYALAHDDFIFIPAQRAQEMAIVIFNDDGTWEKPLYVSCL